MTPYGFLAWVATQGIKHIPKKLLLQAFNSFKKLPPKEVILKTAKNLWDDVIKKTSTKDLTKQIRQKIKKDKPIIPKEFNKFEPYNKFEPKIVKPINVPEQTKNILNIKSTLEGRPVRVVPEKLNPLTDALKTGKYTKVPTPSHLKPPSLRKSNVIPFPKKPPGKADGGRIDKALPKRSRDI